MWLPEDATEIRGAQQTFDQSFTWISFRLPSRNDAEVLLNESCQESDRASTVPTADHLRGFPSEARLRYQSLETSSERATFYRCPDSAREFFAALHQDSYVSVWAY